jgi:hypothetical protein
MAQKADDNHTSNGQPIATDTDNARPAEAGVVPFSRLARLVAALPLHQFISLNAAFAQANSRFRSSDLTAYDLWQHARNRQLTIAARRLSPDGIEQVFLFRSVFWQYFGIWSPSSLHPEAVHVQPRVRVHPILTGRWYFFVGRKRFERLYSTEAPSKPAVQTPAPPTLLTPENPRGAGTKRKFDREFILTEAAAYVVTSGLPKTLEELVHALQMVLRDKMPKDTQGKKILGPFFKRMEQALGR